MPQTSGWSDEDSGPEGDCYGEWHMKCVYDVIAGDPDGAKAYVEFYCLAAGSAKRHIKLAAIVAKGYEPVFGDRSLSRRVYYRAKEIGALDVIEPFTDIDDNDGTTGSVN